MAEGFIQASRIRREDQRFFINSEEVSGVLSVEQNYGTNYQNLVYIGMAGKKKIPARRGNQAGSVSINCNVISKDFFIEFTGENPINGYSIKNNNIADNFSFISGYLTSYNASCSIGEIPQVSAEFTVFGNIGPIQTGDSDNFENILTGGTGDYALKIAAPGSLNVSFDDLETNRLQSYDISIGIERNPLYGVGNRFPYEVKRNIPLELDVDLVFEADDYQDLALRDFPCQDAVRDFSLTLKDVEDDSNIVSYSFTNLHKFNESYSSSVDGNLTYSVKYKGFLFNTGEL